MKSVEQKIGAAKDGVMEKMGMGHSHATEVTFGDQETHVVAYSPCQQNRWTSQLEA